MYRFERGIFWSNKGFLESDIRDVYVFFRLKEKRIVSLSSLWGLVASRTPIHSMYLCYFVYGVCTTRAKGSVESSAAES